jgi:DNA-binding transcriptional ArsR family regulator
MLFCDNVLLRTGDSSVDDDMILDDGIRALANNKRLQILQWLKNPHKHFPPQVDGDLVADGVCSVFIADKLGVSQPTASEHLKILTQAGFVIPSRIKQWIFYKRDEERIRGFKTDLSQL